MFVWPTSHMGMLHPNGDLKARNMARDFLIYGEAAEAGVSYNDAKALLPVSTNQAETRKSFFEELGLLYVPYHSNRLLLTPLGKQLFELLYGQELGKLAPEIARQATALLVWSLAKSQINRPQSRGVPRPSETEWRSCDVRPYALAWMAVGDLGGELHLHEFMGPLRRVHQASDYPAAIKEILQMRAQGAILATPAELRGRAEMNYRIYWRSHLSVADQVLTWSDTEGLLRANQANWDIVGAALRFQAGCAGTSQRAIQGAAWKDAEDYFFNVAGAACPPFLAGGSPTVKAFEGQALADLCSYAITAAGAHFRISGGPELCHLALKMPCFHSSNPTRLLRIDGKQELPGGVIELQLGLGRPIVSLAVLQQVLGGKNV